MRKRGETEKLFKVSHVLHQNLSSAPYLEANIKLKVLLSKTAFSHKGDFSKVMLKVYSFDSFVKYIVSKPIKPATLPAKA